eukprot:TRINITY_DN18544_c0_g1_i1.p1 TRINITY_DN18544_c0_g1~~TRINITY_DN18544_c0_g1_i1.p1  ORF type:complete len:665 (-),score=118.52 TRINITY_DN18544_c0_g1_i1:707-2701(-)
MATSIDVSHMARRRPDQELVALATLEQSSEVAHHWQRSLSVPLQQPPPAAGQNRRQRRGEWEATNPRRRDSDGKPDEKKEMENVEELYYNADKDVRAIMGAADMFRAMTKRSRKTNRVCMFGTLKNCKHGITCRFWHPEDVAVPEGEAVKDNPTPLNLQDMAASHLSYQESEFLTLGDGEALVHQVDVSGAMSADASIASAGDRCAASARGVHVHQPPGSSGGSDSPRHSRSAKSHSGTHVESSRSTGSGCSGFSPTETAPSSVHSRAPSSNKSQPRRPAAHLPSGHVRTDPVTSWLSWSSMRSSSSESEELYFPDSEDGFDVSCGVCANFEGEVVTVTRDNIVRDEVTTLIVADIPRYLTQGALLSMLEDLTPAMRGRYDFFYCPWDAAALKNQGYAVVNFKDADSAATFQERWAGQVICNGCRCPRGVRIAAAKTQGLKATSDKYVEESLRHGCEDERFRPLMGTHPRALSWQPEPLQFTPPQKSKAQAGSNGVDLGVTSRDSSKESHAQNQNSSDLAVSKLQQQQQIFMQSANSQGDSAQSQQTGYWMASGQTCDVRGYNQNQNAMSVPMQTMGSVGFLVCGGGTCGGDMRGLAVASPMGAFAQQGNMGMQQSAFAQQCILMPASSNNMGFVVQDSGNGFFQVVGGTGNSQRASQPQQGSW